MLTSIALCFDGSADCPRDLASKTHRQAIPKPNSDAPFTALCSGFVHEPVIGQGCVDLLGISQVNAAFGYLTFDCRQVLSTKRACGYDSNCCSYTSGGRRNSSGGGGGQRRGKQAQRLKRNSPYEPGVLQVQCDGFQVRVRRMDALHDCFVFAGQLRPRKNLPLLLSEFLGVAKAQRRKSLEAVYATTKPRSDVALSPRSSVWASDTANVLLWYIARVVYPHQVRDRCAARPTHPRLH